MGVKVQRPRCFFDIAINNVPGKKMKTVDSITGYSCKMFKNNTNTS